MIVKDTEMAIHRSLIILASLTLAFTGCSKHAATSAAPNPGVTDLGIVQVSDGTPVHRDLGGGRACDITPAVQTNGRVALDLRFEESGKLLASPNPRILAIPNRPALFSFGDTTYELTPHLKQPPADDKDAILPGRRMSESQVAKIAGRELPDIQSFSCQFTNGVWEILEVQTGAWISSTTTNADGHIFVRSTHPTQVVLRVSDADGQIERIKTP